MAHLTSGITAGADLQTDEYIDLIFNVTLERPPCRFTSLDLFDVTGTKPERAGSTS